jgi:protein TonB
MLDRLLESKGRRSRSPTGVATSVTAHIAIIVIAVHATAQSRPRPMPVQRLVIVPYVPKAQPSEPRQRQATHSSTIPLPANRYVPIVIDSKLPPLDFVPASLTSPTDFTNVRTIVGGSDQSAAPRSLTGTYNADQVERQVTLLSGAAMPRYPEALRIAGVEGRVIAQFTVDERGLVESDSVRFVQSDNALFEASVRDVLKRMRFTPAEIGGRKVRQLVQMPFVFTITGR